MGYSHTQHGKLHWLLYGVAGVELALAAGAAAAPNPSVALVLVVVAIVIVLCGSMFQTLTVSDEGSALRLHFGPVPLFHKRFDYARLTAAEAGRSTLIDGWGIHYIIGRGWIYNLWGRDCVVLIHNGKRVRIGTDDTANLVAFLQTKLARS